MTSIVKLTTIDTNKEIPITEKLEGFEYKPHIIHQVITHYLSSARAGTSKQKTRAEVRGGGRKPWAQKGTGRARSGSTRNPIFRTGGVTFANTGKREFGGKINKKLFQIALKGTIIKKIQDKELFIVEDFGLKEIKTKLFVEKINALKIPFKKILLVLTEAEKTVMLSARNCQECNYTLPNQLHPYSIVKNTNLVFSLTAFQEQKVIT